ncbi:MAG: protein kinase domain-containing protein [Nannocystales bacterium]
MKGCFDEEQLRARVAGVASPKEVALQNVHVALCPRCRERLAEAFQAITRDVNRARTPSACRPGDTVGRYVIERKIGEGGMGTVYAAFDPRLERTVAIKALHLSNRTPDAAREELRHEARAMAQVRSDHVVSVYEVVESHNDLFLVMELVEGVSLSRWLKKRDRPWKEMLELLLQAGRGLADAHECGVLHRDFKPLNVLVRDPDALHPAALVTDFGLSTVLDVPRLVTTGRAPGSSWETEDQGSTVRGTPKYMAPELLNRMPIGPPADQFAFAVSVYQTLWRRAPFSGEGLAALRDAMMADGPAAPPKRGRAKVLWPTIRRGLAWDPAERWPDMTAFCDALEAARDGAAGKRPFIATVAVACSAAALVAGGGEASAACDGAGAAMQAAWDASARARVVASLRSSGTPLAAHASASYTTTVDAYAERWISMRVEVCEDAGALGASPSKRGARLRCLQQGLSATKAAVETVVSGKAGVEDVADIAAELPSLAACTADRVGLTTGLQASGVDEEMARMIEGELATAASLRTAGSLRPAREAAQVAVELAHRHGDARAEARGLLIRGSLENILDGAEQARTTLLQALLLFRGLDDRASVVRVEAKLSTLSSGLDRRTWSERAMLDAVGIRDPEVHAIAVDAAGLDAYYAGELSTAQERFSLALQHAAESSAATRSKILQHLGATFEQRGELPAAAEHFRAAMDLDVEHYGPEHPRVVQGVLTLADLLIHDSKLSDAGALLEGVLETCRANQHPPRVLADALVTSGDLQTRVGDLAAAKALLAEAVELSDANPDIPRRILSDGLQLLSQVHQLEGDADAARPLRERAVTVLQESQGPDDPRTAAAEVALAWTLRELELHDEARALGMHALEVFGDHEGFIRMIPWTHNLLGCVARDTGDSASAIEHHRFAYDVLTTLAGTPGPSELQTLLFKARAERQAGERDAATRTLERAQEVRDEHEADLEPQLVEELDSLVELHAAE